MGVMLQGRIPKFLPNMNFAITVGSLSLIRLEVLRLHMTQRQTDGTIVQMNATKKLSFMSLHIEKIKLVHQLHQFELAFVRCSLRLNIYHD
jgi:hypothetical protein